MVDLCLLILINLIKRELIWILNISDNIKSVAKFFITRPHCVVLYCLQEFIGPIWLNLDVYKDRKCLGWWVVNGFETSAVGVGGRSDGMVCDGEGSKFQDGA